MEITLTHLTAHQVELLSVLWEIEELEDAMAWISTLSLEDQQTCYTLMKLVVAEAVDLELTEDLTQANLVLDKFRL